MATPAHWKDTRCAEAGSAVAASKPEEVASLTEDRARHIIGSLTKHGILEVAHPDTMEPNSHNIFAGATQCHAIRDALEMSGGSTRDLWRPVMAGIASHCSGGRALAHAICEGHPSYMPEDLDAEIDNWKESVGDAWATCELLDAACGCMSRCKFYKKGKPKFNSPKNLCLVKPKPGVLVPYQGPKNEVAPTAEGEDALVEMLANDPDFDFADYAPPQPKGAEDFPEPVGTVIVEGLEGTQAGFWEASTASGIKWRRNTFLNRTEVLFPHKVKEGFRKVNDAIELTVHEIINRTCKRDTGEVDEETGLPIYKRTNFKPATHVARHCADARNRRDSCPPDSDMVQVAPQRGVGAGPRVAGEPAIALGVPQRRIP